MEHSHHSAMPMGCTMSMVWYWDKPHGVCLVFPSLQIGHSNASLLFWLLFLVAISALYEYTRLYASSWDQRLRSSLRGAGGNLSTASGTGATTPRTAGSRRPSGMMDGSEESLLGGRDTRRWGPVRLPGSVQTRRSLMYTGNMALSVYLMLIFMSYNAQIIGAVLVGAFIGHFTFQRSIDLSLGAGDGDDKVGCH